MPIKRRVSAWGWVLPVLLLAFWLGAHNLNADAIWHDEQRSLYYAGAGHYGPVSPVETINRMAENGSGQMPLYYLLLAGWGQIVGWTAFASRALSLMFGALVVALMYRLGKDLGGPGVGLGAALVAATTAYFQTYTHELRPYALMVLLMAVNIWLYWRLLNGAQHLRWLFPLTLAGLLYTQPFAVPGVAALGLYHLVLAPKNRRWWVILGLFGVGGLIFLPWGIITLRVVTTFTGEHADESLSAANNTELIFDVLYSFGNGLPVLVALLLPSLLLLRARPAVRYLWFLTAATFAALIAVNTAVPILQARYVMVLWTMLPAIAGFSLLWLARYRVVMLLLVGVWATSGVYNSLNLHFVDELYDADALSAFRIHLPIHKMADSLATEAVTGDAIAVHLPYQRWAVELVYDYYLYDLPPRYVVIDSLRDEDKNLDSRAAKAFIADANRLWLVTEPGHTSAMLTDFEAILEERGYELCRRLYDEPSLQVALYARRDLYCNLSGGEALVDFGGQVQLTGLEREIGNENASLHTTWTVADFWVADYTISFFLLDDENNVISQGEQPLPPGPLAHSTIYMPIEEVPAGRYNLYATVYNWRTGERLSVPPQADPQAIGLAALGTLDLP